MRIPSIADIEFRGGRICLDFVNTTNWVNGKSVDDRLVDLNAVRSWVIRQKLSKGAKLKGDLGDLLRLRRAVRQIVAHPENVSTKDLAILNDSRIRTAAPIRRTGDCLQLASVSSIDWIMRIIADSAAELILTVGRSRIKTCDGERCGWLFVDDSPNNRRRWCSMADCGNRAKAKRHYSTIRAGHLVDHPNSAN